MYSHKWFHSDSEYLRKSRAAMHMGWLRSKFAKRILRSIGVMLSLYLLVSIYFWSQQRPIIFAPTQEQPSDPKRMGMEFQTVSIPVSPKGQQQPEFLYASWIPAENPEAPVILYLHGQEATRGKNLAHAESFHQCGYHVLIVDYRGYAESYDKETPCEAKVYEDALAALNYLKDQHPSERIFIHGHSLGGAIAIELAARPEAEGTAGLIVESSLTSVRDMCSQRYYGLLRLLPVDLILTERFDSIGKVDKIHRPILFIHGKEDTKIPCWMSQELREKAGDNAELLLIEGAGHADCCLIGKVEYRTKIREFVSRCLGQSHTSGTLESPQLEDGGR